MKYIIIVQLLFSSFAVLFAFSTTEDGRAFMSKYEVYNYELISTEYKLVKKNGGDERALKHIFNRKQKITGIQSIYISVFNIDGYKKYSTDYDLFSKLIS